MTTIVNLSEVSSLKIEESWKGNYGEDEGFSGNERNMTTTTFENVKSALKFSPATSSSSSFFFLCCLTISKGRSLLFASLSVRVYENITFFAAAFLYSGQNTNVGYSCATVKDNERWVKREIYSGMKKLFGRILRADKILQRTQKRKKNWNVLRKIFLCTNKCYNTTYAIVDAAVFSVNGFVPHVLDYLCQKFSPSFSSPCLETFSSTFLMFPSPEKELLLLPTS